LFQGNKILFKDLWIEKNWDWSKKHPVIYISFAALDFLNDNLAAAISDQLLKFNPQNRSIESWRTKKL
jgi:hypothetical protein